MPFTFLSCDDFLRNNLKNYLYTSTQVRLMYHVLDMRAIGPPTSSSNTDTPCLPELSRIKAFFVEKMGNRSVQFMYILVVSRQFLSISS